MLYAKELKQIYCKELKRNLECLGKYAEILGENTDEDGVQITYNTMENIDTLLYNASKSVEELRRI